MRISLTFWLFWCSNFWRLFRHSGAFFFLTFKMSLRTVPKMLKVSLFNVWLKIFCIIQNALFTYSLKPCFEYVLVYDKQDGPLTTEEEEQRTIAKIKMLGNIKFIGELGKLNLIHESILHKCIKTVRWGSVPLFLLKATEHVQKCTTV